MGGGFPREDHSDIHTCLPISLEYLHRNRHSSE